MTKDNVSLYLTSVIYYRITSPHKAAFGITNIRQALVERTQTTLRHVVGARILQDVIERREELAQDIKGIVDEVATHWGCEVESMLVKDIIFSQELQESLSMAAQSKRTGEAKVIAARAEVESAKLMRQAADILSSAPAMQIRYVMCKSVTGGQLLTRIKIPRGYAADGQIRKLKGHFPPSHKSNRPRADRKPRTEWREPIKQPNVPQQQC
jgi:regulator of protease activity HflC (stomatin/prohibitin superfamily)